MTETMANESQNDDVKESKEYRPKYDDVVSVDVMDGLKEFCDEFSCIIVPPTDTEIEYAKKQKQQNDDEEDCATMSMINSLHNIIDELSDNLNTSIVDIGHLQSAEHGLSASIKECGDTVINNLEIRINEIEETFKQIDTINELIQIIEIEYVNKYKQRYNQVLSLCDSKKMIQRQLKSDPIGTIKKQYIKTIKQNKPRIEKELKNQKQALKRIKNDITYSAKSVFSKIKSNQNISSFETAKEADVENSDDVKMENDKDEKMENVDVDKYENEVDEDQMRAIQEYEWTELPMLPDWNELIDAAKKKQHKNKSNDDQNKMHEIKIKWLTDPTEENMNDDSDDESVSKSHKNSLSVDLP